jgi:excisionase family DNA binding protein
MASTLPPAKATAVQDPISVKIPEAVRLTGMSRSRIYELIRSGDIEVVKVGASTLILTASIRAFIESLRKR